MSRRYFAMIGISLSSIDEKTVVKTYALTEVKGEWKSDIGEEDLLLIRQLHQLTQDNL